MRNLKKINFFKSHLYNRHRIKPFFCQFAPIEYLGSILPDIGGWGGDFAKYSFH